MIIEDSVGLEMTTVPFRRTSKSSNVDPFVACAMIFAGSPAMASPSAVIRNLPKTPVFELEKYLYWPCSRIPLRAGLGFPGALVKRGSDIALSTAPVFLSRR